MSTKTIVVTGGAGFIGSHLVDALERAGDRVVVIDNLTSERRSDREVDHVLDIRGPSLPDLFEQIQPDVVIHLAAQISVRQSVVSPPVDAWVNVTGTVNVLQAAYQVKCHKVLIASSGGAVYGEQTGQRARETHRIAPQSPYGVSKYCSEQYADYYTRMGMPVIPLRFSNVYGPRQDPHGEAGVVAIFTRHLLAGDTVTINGSGEQTRDFVYVDDVVRAMILVMDREVPVQPYNVGTGTGVSINQVYTLLRQLIGTGTQAMYGPAKSGEQLKSVISHARITRAVGWKPEVTLREGLKRTVEYWKGQS